MLDLILRKVRLADQEALVDIAIRDGVIVDIVPNLVADGPSYDLDGNLVCPGFVETHIHLDKACLMDRSGDHDGTLASAIMAVAKAKAAFTEDDVYNRGRKTIEKAIVQGTNTMRTHVETDPRVDLRSFNAIRQLKKDYAWALDLQICVFPQEGLTNDPGTEDLLRQALDQGADLLGGCPYTDRDPLAQIDRLFKLAVDFDVDLDFHLDFDLEPSWNHLDEVVRKTVAHGWQGRVTVGHVTKLSMLPPAELQAMAKRLVDADIAVTVLPSTDLFLMGRGQHYAVPRGVAPAYLLAEQGVRCSISTNNVLNPFTPYGDCSLVRMANLYANIAQIGDMPGLSTCFDMVTEAAARIVGRDHAIGIGVPATLIALPAADKAKVVAEITRPSFGMKNGRMTFHQPAAELYGPNHSDAEFIAGSLPPPFAR
ncbi:MAG: amidohydrolase family protein [Alphaproteobacteria bacterium]|nr:amidohydrolase family protein [Alphaproteobacteria bacterium]